MEKERQTDDPKRFDRGRSEGRLAWVDRGSRAEGRAYLCYQRCTALVLSIDQGCDLLRACGNNKGRIDAALGLTIQSRAAYFR
jgi:hypothetical protein